MSVPGTHVVLMGMMGSGKTTVGRALAERLGVAYADNDDALVEQTGRDAAAMVSQVGADALHAVEHEILAAALRREDGAVVGAPGSVALDAAAASMLAGHHVAWLRASVATLLARVRRDPLRPLLGSDPAAVLGQLAAEREPGFRRLATIVVDVDRLSVAAVVDEVCASL